MQKKLLAKKLAYNKNPQFIPNNAEIQEIVPTHELVILTKFRYFWISLYCDEFECVGDILDRQFKPNFIIQYYSGCGNSIDPALLL